MTLCMAWELWLLAAAAGTPGQAASGALPKPSPVLTARWRLKCHRAHPPAWLLPRTTTPLPPNPSGSSRQEQEWTLISDILLVLAPRGMKGTTGHCLNMRLYAIPVSLPKICLRWDVDGINWETRFIGHGVRTAETTRRQAEDEHFNLASTTTLVVWVVFFWAHQKQKPLMLQCLLPKKWGR